MAFSHSSRPLSLALAGLALAATACADVGSSSEDEFPVVKSTDQDVVVCQSIRTAIQRDKKAGNQEAVASGVEGAKSVKGGDVSDLVPAAGAATPSAG